MLLDILQQVEGVQRDGLIPCAAVVAGVELGSDGICKCGIIRGDSLGLFCGEINNGRCGCRGNGVDLCGVEFDDLTDVLTYKVGLYRFNAFGNCDGRIIFVVSLGDNVIILFHGFGLLFCNGIW